MIPHPAKIAGLCTAVGAGTLSSGAREASWKISLADDVVQNGKTKSTRCHPKMPAPETRATDIHFLLAPPQIDPVIPPDRMQTVARTVAAPRPQRETTYSRVQSGIRPLVS